MRCTLPACLPWVTDARSLAGRERMAARSVHLPGAGAALRPCLPRLLCAAGVTGVGRDISWLAATATGDITRRVAFAPDRVAAPAIAAGLASRAAVAAASDRLHAMA